MKILNDGIYFKQSDHKKDGYYTTDDNGDLIHLDYKKPTFWQRTKYYAKNGYEMNLETRRTSYFYFLPNYNQVYMESRDGDAVSTALYVKKNRNYRSSHKYKIEDNTIIFETEAAFYRLVFSDDSMYIKEYVQRKSDKTYIEPTTYTYLNWYNI